MQLVTQYEENLRELTATEAQINELVAVHRERLEDLKKKDAELREALKGEMKKEGIKKYESDLLSLTYIAASERVLLDSKRLKEEKPDLWNEYSKTTPVSDSVRIKVKEQNE